MSLIIARRQEKIRIKDAMVIDKSAPGWLRSFVNTPKTKTPIPIKTIAKTCHHLNLTLRFTSGSSSIML